MTAAALRAATAGLASTPVVVVLPSGEVSRIEAAYVEYRSVEGHQVDRCPARLVIVVEGSK